MWNAVCKIRPERISTPSSRQARAGNFREVLSKFASNVSSPRIVNEASQWPEKSEAIRYRISMAKYSKCIENGNLD